MKTERIYIYQIRDNNSENNKTLFSIDNNARHMRTLKLILFLAIWSSWGELRNERLKDLPKEPPEDFFLLDASRAALYNMKRQTYVCCAYCRFDISHITTASPYSNDSLKCNGTDKGYATPPGHSIQRADLALGYPLKWNVRLKAMVHNYSLKCLGSDITKKFYPSFHILNLNGKLIIMRAPIKIVHTKCHLNKRFNKFMVHINFF